ncbi:hypothetical protein [Pseudobacter ginsenosidimutans]|uniref:Uncharacterized protein n=1 Tax=Pseudobacter ginsenosidimutans TaxID=661488 RepID=A0A4Q7N300_9BACT|nr:hypothetical protein [Pseudobacter ginsenosidimutans]QEC43987.1 hypothetical protein FSB84_20755 [Pseudobacter ginsenosidimutans]RZS75424.1 hypothetical protein EV199_1290 [Pseudobacter ginsenosidimutans]
MESVHLERINADKQRIIDQMYAELENTPVEDRFYTSGNIESCSTDLDTYIKKLSQNPDSKSISKSIKWIFQSLSTFNQEDESPEYLWGFIYNGYTKELTEFILHSAFAFGLQKGEPKMIRPANIHLKHNPHSTDRFRVYIGSTSNDGIVLDYNVRSSQFEYLENIYGESYGLPVFDLTINKDHSELSFDVLASGVYETITLKAQQPTDSVLFNAVYSLHNSEQLKNDPPPDHCSLELELTKGVLTRLTTMNYDTNNRIINMFTEGTGIKVFVQELDANGCFRNSDNMASHPEIVDEKFVIVDAVPNWKYYEIDELVMQQDIISVRTKKQRFEYENDERKKVIAHESAGRNISYPIKSYDLIKALLHELLLLRKPFKSRY